MIKYEYTITIESREPATIVIPTYPELTERVYIFWPTIESPLFPGKGEVLYSDFVKYCPEYNNGFTIATSREDSINRLIEWGWPVERIFRFYTEDYGKRVTFDNGYSGIFCDNALASTYGAKNRLVDSVGFVTDDLEYIPLFRVSDYCGAFFVNINGAIDNNLLCYNKLSGGSSSAGYRGSFQVPSFALKQVASEEQIAFITSSKKGDDPYGPGGGSGTGGGGGDFDNTSTPIDIPSLPTISAASTGFITLYNPSLSELNNLSSYLWSDLFEIDGWKKLFADPMDAILGLSIVPVSILPGGQREVKVGNVGTGISLTVAASQFVEVDCGTIDVNEYWGAYLDYEPYTQAQIFLPYIGTRPISVDEIMGKTVRVVYHVDILTGACCCFVKCGDSVLYTYNGQCSIPIPITSANYTSVVNGVISIAASVGSLVSTGGASAPTAIPAIASSAVNQMKPQVEKSGSISGSAGVLNMQIPYLILIRPRQALPSKQNEFIGYPSLITVQLTELSGYTEVQSIHLENIPATQEELAEIQSLLEGGVIF